MLKSKALLLLNTLVLFLNLIWRWAITLPIFLWCPLKWHFPKKDITRLQRTQTHPFLSLPKELHWLPVAQRIQFRTLVHTFKSLNNLLPHYISSLLPLRKPPTFSLRSCTVTCLHVPKTRTPTSNRAFLSSAPRLWNNLPAMIRGTNAAASFKKSLIRHLFHSYLVSLSLWLLSFLFTIFVNMWNFGQFRENLIFRQ